MELWRQVKSYPGYEVSNHGKVKNKHGRLLAIRQGTGGYLQITLSKNGTSKTFGVHRLVATAFCPNPKNKRTVNHKNGNKFDNRSSNLEWSTDKENIGHAIESGARIQRGEKYHLSKLTKKDVIEIRQRLSNGETQSKLAAEYGVDRSNIYAIKTRKSWNHI